MTERTILIIDDEKRLSRSLQLALSQDGYSVQCAHSAADGIQQAMVLKPKLILLDLRLPDSEDLNPLAKLKSELPEVKVLMMSAHGDIRVAVDAVKAGAFDFITKPFDINELKTVVSHCMFSEVSTDKNSHSTSKRELVGGSDAMNQLKEKIQRVANSSARTLLLQGPSGTGKTLVASEIHARSNLANQPFIEVNCAALPENLLEAELFGAEKGSYTGAHVRRQGLIEAADGGVLFLDEIGELSLPMQAKLLTFLENHSYRAVGSSQLKYAQMRVIVATNRQLAKEVASGLFRADLYYRLNVMPLDIPALTEREGDVPMLLDHFSKNIAAKESCQQIRFSPEVLDRLSRYAWPGNVRELKNMVERLTILFPGEFISVSHLPDEMFNVPTQNSQPIGDGADFEEQLAHTEKDLILKALTESGGHKGKAAEALNLSRHALKRRLQKLGLQ